jgi:hypothetical protein
MRPKSIIKPASKRKINWALPNQTVTQAEFSEAIKEAEEGPFYTVQESMLHFEKWLSSRKKQ